MRLLIITQKINKNDPILGFFHGWIREFSKHFESVIGICLEKGEYDLPANVRVLSLGKEEGNDQLPMINDPFYAKATKDKQFSLLRSPLRYELRRASNSQFFKKIKYTLRFWSYIWRERKNYDAVFVHMNPVYVVLGGLIWKIFRKPIYLWYTHKSVDLKLGIAEKFVNKVFSASKESFRLKSKKLIITGHGISIEKFINTTHIKDLGSLPIRIIHIGRITPIKNLDTLIETAKYLKEKWNKEFVIDLIGQTVYESDQEYKTYLRDLISKYNLNNIVHFYGNVSNDKIALELARSDTSMNLTPTGGLDKSVLESMAFGVPVFSSNKTFEGYFGEYKERLIFKEKNAKDLAEKVMNFFDSKDIELIANRLKDIAIEKGNIIKLLDNISEKIKNQK